MSDASEIWEAITGQEFKEFSRILNQVDETNIFPSILRDQNFSKVGDYLFKKGNDQLIKVFHERGKWQYTNLKNSQDRGSLIQFIANRACGQGIEIATNPKEIFLAATVAKEYYQRQIKSLKNEHKEKPLLLGSSSQIKRRR